jgi:hypothetical protein
VRGIEETFGHVLVGDQGHAAHWYANQPGEL